MILAGRMSRSVEASLATPGDGLKYLGIQEIMTSDDTEERLLYPPTTLLQTSCRNILVLHCMSDAGIFHQSTTCLIQA